FAAPATAHMSMVRPLPRKYMANSSTKPRASPDGPTEQVCQGRQPSASVETYKAGQSIDVRIDGEIFHGGGHCQFAVSYDNEKTFVVLKTVKNDCLRSSLSYSVPIPADAPPGKATFAWIWFNATGEREAYMNCADITVDGKIGGSITGPKALYANTLGGPILPEFFSD
ncbi:hypothetical protein THASP1DRAFT_7443, partial [Thamnocephalis sphaerospora]